MPYILYIKDILDKVPTVQIQLVKQEVYASAFFCQYCHGWPILVESFIFVNNLGFSYTVPMISKSQVGNALTEYFEGEGLHTVMPMDGANELLARMLGWQDILSQHGGIKKVAFC